MPVQSLIEPGLWGQHDAGRTQSALSTGIRRLLQGSFDRDYGPHSHDIHNTTHPNQFPRQIGRLWPVDGHDRWSGVRRCIGKFPKCQSSRSCWTRPLSRWSISFYFSLSLWGSACHSNVNLCFVCMCPNWNRIKRIWPWQIWPSHTNASNTSHSHSHSWAVAFLLSCVSVTSLAIEDSMVHLGRFTVSCGFILVLLNSSFVYLFIWCQFGEVQSMPELPNKPPPRPPPRMTQSKPSRPPASHSVAFLGSNFSSFGSCPRALSSPVSRSTRATSSIEWRTPHCGSLWLTMKTSTLPPCAIPCPMISFWWVRTQNRFQHFSLY